MVSKSKLSSHTLNLPELSLPNIRYPHTQIIYTMELYPDPVSTYNLYHGMSQGTLYKGLIFYIYMHIIPSFALL